MARYIDADKLLTDEKIHTLPIGCGKASGNIVVFVDDIEKMPTADVAPKSEVEKLNKEFDELAEEHSDLIIEKDHLFDEVVRLREVNSILTEAGQEWQKRYENLAREIFEEIEKRLAMYSHIHKYAEEANKVTEEYADGSPVEMTSVWDACRLEHNGYDDYETMCQLQDNIGNIEKSRLLKEFEVDIAQLKKKYTEGET